MNQSRFETPVFHSFRNGNAFTGNVEDMRFKIEPCIDRDAPENNCLRVSVWHEDLCFELCEVDAQQEFPLEAEGLEEVLNWLEAAYQQTRDDGAP